jgi:uncharacterized protein (DUF1800 family)
MRTAAWLTASALLMATATTASTASTGAPASTPPDPVAAHWRALSRFGYGPTPATTPAGQPTGMAWARSELERAVAAASRPAAVPDGLRDFAAPLPQLFAAERDSRQQRRRASSGPDPANARQAPVSAEWARQAAHWRLQACSDPALEAPLLARMTEFWFNHLNVSAGKAAARPFVGHYLLHAIRPHALGRYEDLLLASAKHPAMLMYLDQARSVAEGSAPGRPGEAARGLNENYARELLELHTLGVNGGYTQNDVRELARLLTGWTVAPDQASGFRFVARLHDTGSKQLLGQTVAAGGGLEEGEAALRRLARHPATARRLATRLAQWFVADTPPPALVERLTQRYLDTGGDIAAVLRTLIDAPETWAPSHTLFKTPLDYACSALAAVGGAGDERQALLAGRFLQAAGQPLLAWPTPDGYPTLASSWLSPEALAQRADLALSLGRQLAAPDSLAPWIAPARWARIRQEPVALQAGLALASPDFMRK